MKNKTIIVFIVIFAILTTCNIVGVFAIENVLNRPLTAYSVEVLGTAFKEESTESNVIDIDLIRPPRTVVVPGETTHPKSTARNVADFDIYLRAIYRIEVRDSNGNVIPDMDKLVKVNINEGWRYQGDYWFYKDTLKPGESVPSLVNSVEYSEEFKNYLDYDVYIPVLVESVETRDARIEDVIHWPNKDINKINPMDYIDDNMSWTQSTEIKIY